jgi:hypothetical protein
VAQGLDSAENDERVILRVRRGNFVRGYWKRDRKTGITGQNLHTMTHY